jgi:hypothetical protein
MGAGAQRAHEQFTEIQSEASQVRDILLLFIFVASLCLIHFNRDRPSRLWDVVTLDGSSLQICAVTTEVKNTEQPLATNASMSSSPPLLHRQCYFILFVDVHM